MALALGLVSALALPPIGGVPLLLIAIPGLLWLIGEARGSLTAFRRGWWFGFGHHLFGLYWITEAILFEAARLWWAVPLAVPALAAGLALFIALPAALAFRLGRAPLGPAPLAPTPLGPAPLGRALVLAGAWVLGDLARQFIATGFPWNLFGSVWELPGWLGDVMIQPAAWISVHGLTLLTLLLAAAPTLPRRFRIAAGAVLLGWFGLGVWRLQTPPPPAPGISVALIQGNVAEGQKWSRDGAAEIFNRYLQLTRQAMSQGPARPRLVIWPETASPYLLTQEPAARHAIQAAAEDATVLAGTVRFDQDGRPRNALIVLTPASDNGGQISRIYDKWHLVPFGEYQPGWFPLPFQVVPGGGFAAGPGPETLDLPDLPPVGPLICYEGIFPAQVVDEANRPQWMVNITNDAWFGDSTGPRQHLATVRMRAVEEGLPVLRAANTGITAGFDAFGHELARLPREQAAILDLPLPGALPPTLFARTGLLLPLFMACASVILGVALGRRAGEKPANR
jgi:apolipoprotein N-acyltransferase